MSAKRRTGRPPIGKTAMTPAERKQRSRFKAKLEVGRAKASLAVPRRFQVDARPVKHRDPVKEQLAIERVAYVHLMAPLNGLLTNAPTEDAAHELLEQMNAGQRRVLGRMARKAMEVVAILAALPDVDDPADAASPV